MALYKQSLLLPFLLERILPTNGLTLKKYETYCIVNLFKSLDIEAYKSSMKNYNVIINVKYICF